MTTLTGHRSTTPLPLHPHHVPMQIYRMFFLAAIAVILTAGAAWGAMLLWQISRSGSFTDVSIHAVNAHGHAQIFGWVGLFIMGFACQAFPRMWRTRLAAPHLAIAAFILMLVGLMLCTVGQAAIDTWAMALQAVIIGGVMQIIAVLFFAGLITVTLVRSNERVTPATGFIFAALFWFVLMTVANLWHTAMLMSAESREALLAQIATYQPALRDMQIHGLALAMILGVSKRFFPSMFGIARTPAWRGWLGLALITLAVIGEVTLLVTSQASGDLSIARWLIAPWVLLAAGVAVIVLPWRLWRPLPERHRSTKFVRVAYLWLGIALAMLLLMPVYMVMRDMTFSHAYYGAMRHAITVGFISMMIMGVSATVVPSLRGADERRLSALWVPFVLVNTGCALRVTMQVLTDWHDIGFAIIGVSGTLEVIGLAWWGIGLTILMFRPARLPEPCGCSKAQDRTHHVTAASPTPHQRADRPSDAAIIAATCSCCEDKVEPAQSLAQSSARSSAQSSAQSSARTGPSATPRAASTCGCASNGERE